METVSKGSSYFSLMDLFCSRFKMAGVRVFRLFTLLLLVVLGANAAVYLLAVGDQQPSVSKPPGHIQICDVDGTIYFDDHRYLNGTCATISRNTVGDQLFDTLISRGQKITVVQTNIDQAQSMIDKASAQVDLAVQNLDILLDWTKIMRATLDARIERINAARETLEDASEIEQSIVHSLEDLERELGKTTAQIVQTFIEE
jgi:hypothetical protein